ncbi:hypothetical protein [Streptomyces sp. RFCAC02]|uniref:hypothetical protein n=1 Tax=Streptomyces sp. RFCAC02 TaxID=2499143 RepID=UPI00102172D6|nr:hypothetical protein [Streptomyces sp. RFCAC02]
MTTNVPVPRRTPHDGRPWYLGAPVPLPVREEQPHITVITGLEGPVVPLPSSPEVVAEEGAGDAEDVS